MSKTKKKSTSTVAAPASTTSPAAPAPEDTLSTGKFMITKEGLQQALLKAFEDGKEEGFKKGHLEGVEAGLLEGHNIGVLKGLKRGLESGEVERRRWQSSGVSGGIPPCLCKASRTASGTTWTAAETQTPVTPPPPPSIPPPLHSHSGAQTNVPTPILCNASTQVDSPNLNPPSISLLVPLPPATAPPFDWAEDASSHPLPPIFNKRDFSSLSSGNDNPWRSIHRRQHRSHIHRVHHSRPNRLDSLPVSSSRIMTAGQGLIGSWVFVPSDLSFFNRRRGRRHL